MFFHAIIPLMLMFCSGRLLALVSTIQLLPCFTCSTKAQSDKQVCLSSVHFVVLCTEISHSVLAPGGWD